MADARPSSVLGNFFSSQSGQAAFRLKVPRRVLCPNVLEFVERLTSKLQTAVRSKFGNVGSRIGARSWGRSIVLAIASTPLGAVVWKCGLCIVLSLGVFAGYANDIERHRNMSLFGNTMLEQGFPEFLYPSLGWDG